MTTLVVDDDPLVAEELAFFLVRRGLPALIAHRVADALGLIGRRPDIGVVVADIRMPDGSGRELAAELARTQGTRSGGAAPGDTGGPGVILITGHATLDGAGAAVRSGDFDFLRKPFRMTELEAAVRRVLERTRVRRQRESIHAAEAAQPETVARAVTILRNADGEIGFLDRAGMLDAVAALPRSEETQPACVVSVKLVFPESGAASGGPDPLASREAAAALRLAASRRLREAAGLGDVIGRLAADEYAILRTGADAESCAGWVTRLHAALCAPYRVGAMPEVRPWVKLGAAHSARLTDVALWHAGQIALTIAALRPGSSVEWFEPDPRYAGRIRHVLQDRIRHGLISAEFQFRFQPIFSVSERKLTGFEALLRWHDPEHGIISPADFVPIAEKYDLIPALDEMLLRRAVEHVRTWRQDFGFTGCLNVNVSPITLRDPAYATAVIAALRDADLPAGQLCLEITEAVALDPAIQESLAAIRAAGAVIAIDDFGTGHSSLARWLDLPADIVKFDRVFLHAVRSDQVLAEFLNASIRLMRLCHLLVVAEGVETRRDWDLVRRAGFDFAQGYWLGVPLEAAEAEQLMVRA